MIATSSVSIVNVNDGATGATGPQGVSVTKVVEEYRLSNSSTELTGSGTGYTWSETKPDIPSGKYLWIRERTDLSNNTSSYGTAHCDIVISGLVYDVNQNTQSITSKVWQSDITNSINTYDGSTGAAIRDRVTQTEQDISGITTRVSDVETTTDGLGTRMTTAESNITQNANNITTKVSKDGVISSINQSAETVKISASKVNIEGAVTFSSFDSTLQNRLTTAESDASTAKSNASSAVSTANTASSNASSALTKVNNSIKSTTMHYLATSASSGVTTSTSGWTTTIQSITNDKPYLWTYQTITKINDTTSNTDPVISGVYGATGGKGDTGTGVTKVEQLYRTSNSTTAPAAPTSAVSSTSTSYNTWTLAMPTYNTSYPYYYICTQTTYDNGTVKWTTVSRSKALEDANSTANTANTNASNAVSTANTANTNASNAVSTANTANTNASNAVTTANQAKSKADSAASLLSTWTGDATLATTTIDGGYIKTHTIESTHLATNAIMSQNYTSLDNSHFSSEGSYLDLSTGNFYTPKFGVSAEGQGGAYINGEVVATSGRFGNDTSYWNIATVYDYNSQPHASLVGTGSPYLQTGNWQVSDNAVATRKYTSTSESAGNATYYKDSDTNTFYDVGMKIPTDFSSTAATNDVGRYNKAFYYGRKYTGNNPPTVEGNWVYFYMLDTSGNLKTAGTITTGGDIYEGGTKLSEKYAAISDVGSVYLPKTGGTITGNLTVNGSFTTNLQLQTNLGSTSSAQLTGAANAVVKPGVTGTLGVGNGGTGKSSWTANQIVYASASNTLSQLGSGTSGQILKSNGSSAPSWVNQSTLSVGSATKATQDGNGNVIVNTYMPIAGGQFTGAVYVPDEFSADSAQLGSLIVNGAARFTNDVFANTFTGNLVGTASNAVQFSSNQSISLTGDTTGNASSQAGWSITTTTNKLSYQPQLTTQDAIDGFIEASKFMVATFKTTDANNIGMASNDGMIMSLAWQSTAYGAQLALDDITTGVLKIRGKANSVWGDWRTVIHDGNYTNYTVTKAGTGASGTWGISISGNAATASSAAAATRATQDSVGNQINTYYTPISYMPFRSGRDFTDGTLIITNLTGGTTTCSIPFLLKIIGNGYGNGFVETYVQGYVYHLDDGYTTYISTDAFSNSKTFASKVYAFKNSDGYLSFWFERMAYWQGFDVQCYDTSENMHTTRTINHVTSVTNSALPSTRSYTTEIDVRQGLSSSNYHNYTVKKDGTGATGTWGINVTGTASKLATARTISLTGSVTGSVSFDGSGDVSIATTTNHTHNYAGSNSAGGALSTGVAWAAGTDNAARRVWFSNTNSTNTVAYPVYDDDFKYNPSTNVLTVGSISGSAAYLTTGRTLTIGNTGKTFNGSSDVSWTKADISANATTSANGWMSSDDKTKLNGIQAGAQVNTITGVKGGSETDYRTGNVNITASNIGLGNVTNNKQVKGLASGITSGHLVSWGSDGYTVADSGLTATSVATKITLAGSDYSASSNTITITQANLQNAVQSTGLLLMTSAERSKLASIQVSEGGTIDFSGVTASTPLTATVGTNKTVNITHNTSGVTAGTYRSVTVNTYGHVTAGTNPTTLSGYGITDAKIASGVITLGSNTITPLTASSTLDATKLSGTASISTTGNAATATTASKADKLTTGRTISLTGDVTGSTTFDGSGNVSITATVTDNSHYHAVNNLTLGDTWVSGSLDPVTSAFIGSAVSNKSFGLPANAITIQYSTNGGSTWTDYGATDAQKKELFAEVRGTNFILGKSSSVSTNTVNNQLRVIIEPLDRYVSFHGIYVWLSSNGNTCVMDLERSTIGAKDTFTTVFTNQPISGWSGNNIRYFSYGSFGGGSTQTSNNYKYRITFKQTAVSTSYNSAVVNDIRFIGSNVWSSPNTMVSKNHMYTWDANLNVTFPANVTATTFVGALSGNATSATTASAFTSAKSITLTGDTTGTDSSTGGWSITTTTRKVTSVGRLASANVDNSTDAYKNKLSYILVSSGMTEGKPPDEGGILNFAWDGGKWGAQLAIRINATPHLYLRGNNSTSWDSSWLTVLDSNNYNNYAPTKTGTGASGTWGISISGNAATASKLATSRSLWGNSFDGSSNITGHIKLPATNSVIQTLADTSNWGLGLCWDKTTSYTQSYRPGIGFFNLGGNNGNGAISIVPYAQDTSPWGGSVGLFLTQDDIKFNNVSLVKNSGTWGISVTGNAATSTKWASAQTVYVALGTASKTTSIQGGSSSAVTLGVDGVLGVANGGTGASSFTANSVIMSGSSTTGAFTTRAVTNNTSASAVTANTNLITANTLAYWTGSSNLTTCSQGTFGTAATYSATTSVTSGSSALVTSGGVSTALGSYVTLSTTQTISGTKTFSAATSFTNTTASTSKSTGAVKVSGGLGVAGQVSANTAMIGDAVSLVYDSSISALCFQFA